MSDARPRPGVVVLGLTIAVALVTGAWGQGLPAIGVGDAFQAEFLRRDLATFSEYLDMDDDQAIVVETLFLDYESAFSEGSKAVREEIGRLKPPTRDDSVYQESRERLRTRTRELVEEARTQSSRARSASERRRVMERYQQKVRALREQFRAETSQSVDPAYDVMMTEMALAIEAWDVDRKRLRDSFVLNVQAILSDEQRARWPELEKRLRREKTLHRGRLSGESVDLIAIIRLAGIDGGTLEMLEPIVSSYADRLDVELKRRNERERAGSTAVREAMAKRELAAFRTFATRLVDARVSVRDVNLEFVEAITGMLSEDAGAAYQRLFEERAFENVYAPTRAERVLRAAAGMRLSPEQAAAVLAIQEEYLGELVFVNDDLRRVILLHEPARERERLERAMGFTSDEEKRDDPIDESLEQRRVMGERFLQRLSSVLSEEQLERLPGYGRKQKQAEQRRSTKPLSKDEIMKQFDRNRNGRIDDAEREAMRKHLQKEMKKDG